MTSRLALTALTVATLALAACSSDVPDGDGEPHEDQTVVTFRLWDDTAAEAYKESFTRFTADNPDIRVEVELVPWTDYWNRLPDDIADGEMADIFWTNTSNFGMYADEGHLMDIGEVLGDDHDAWNESVADLYTREGTLWGVPQLSDAIGLFYNKDLVEEAGVDVDSLQWSPASSQDTFLPALKKLTVDAEGHHPGDDEFDPDNIEVWGFNAQEDLHALWLGFLAQNGGQFQHGDAYVFSSTEGVAAFEYLVDLINSEHVAPPATDTNADGDLTRNLFVQGKLALFQSGQYSLPAVSEVDSFEWGVAPIVAGPHGRIGVVHGVAALANAHTKHPQETTRVLEWIASSEGQLPLAETGAAIPAVLDAQDAFTDYWQDRGVDASAFTQAAAGPTTPAPVGPRSNAGLDAMGEVFDEMFEARIPVKQALEQAQQAANEAIVD